MAILTIGAILVSVISALIIATLDESARKLRNFITLLACGLGAYAIWRITASTIAGVTTVVAGEIGFLKWRLGPDPLGVVYALIASTLWVFAAIYSYGYMAHDHKQRTFFTFFVLSAGMTLGIALAGNLLLLYIFYELLTFTTYPLVIHRGDEEALSSGNKYIRYSLVGAAFLLVGIVITWLWTGGNLSFGAEPILGQLGPRPGMGWLFLVFFIGFGVKAAVMPLHSWLPSAMVAPTPISALLHAVAVVNAGVFGLLRVVYSVFGADLLRELGFVPYVLGLIVLTILVASLLALRQDVMKKRLAYSTISQLSYILLGAFTLHPLGLAGAIIHMFNHSILKMALFFSAGIIAEETEQVRISQLGGLGKALPWVFGGFGVASLGMIGMLPLNGFWSKYYLMQGSVQSGYWPLVLVLVTSALLNAFYFLPITVNAFRGSSEVKVCDLGRNHWLMLAPTLVLIGFALVLGIWPDLAWPIVDTVVKQFF